MRRISIILNALPRRFNTVNAIAIIDFAIYAASFTFHYITSIISLIFRFHNIIVSYGYSLYTAARPLLCAASHKAYYFYRIRHHML